jgi:hypothetical protein
MIISGPDLSLRAFGAALAGGSIVFAGYMLAYGDGQVRILGMEHLAIFAQPRGPAITGPSPSELSPLANETAVDMAATGSVTAPAPRTQTARPLQIVAARSDRIWLRMDGKIVAVSPGEVVPGLGRIVAILRRGGEWRVLDDRGATLMTLPDPVNGAALFSRKLIFD